MIATFYIYVDGSDLDEIAPELRARIDSFVAPYKGRVRVVDQRGKVGVSDDLPDWDLGVNFELVVLTIAERKDLLQFFQILSGEIGRDFVLGGILQQNQTDDFMAISAGASLASAIDLLCAE